MKILHYMFGIPPVRAGGMIQYASDLMIQQQQMGETVCLLLPGTLPAHTRKKTAIYRKKADYLEIPTYVIYHPLPVAVCNGILDTAAYTAACTGNAFASFLHRQKPSVIHIHTFMGLHREFLEEARRLGIPVIYTSHDYFGICPSAVLLAGGQLCTGKEWNNCAKCCKHAFPQWRLRMEQSAWYSRFRRIERLAAIGKKCFYLAETHKHNIIKSSHFEHKNSKNAPDYHALREYYLSMFRMVSCFHFNSTLAKETYHSILGQIQSGREAVLPVSHAGIADRRKSRSYGKTLRIGYIGSWSEHKGFFTLLHACRWLVQNGCTDLELHLYSSTARRTEPFVKNHPGFAPKELGAVMDSIDVLAVPSRWRETFGLVVLEAASFGVPVVMSEYVGARDILKGNADAAFVYDGTLRGLKETLYRIYMDRELLVQANRCLLEMEFDFSFESHTRRMRDIYRESIEGDARRGDWHALAASVPEG